MSRVQVKRRLPVSIEALENRQLLSAATFHLVPTTSKATANGTILGNPVSQQSAGSLTDHFTGNVSIDVTATTVQLTGLALQTADSGGVFQPNGTAANFAGQATVFGMQTFFSIRNLTVDETSTPQTLGAGGTFASSGLYEIKTGQVDYAFAGGPTSTTDLAGQKSTNKAKVLSSYVVTAGQAKLTLKVNIAAHLSILSKNDVIVHLVGTFIARGKAPTTTVVVAGAHAVPTGTFAAAALGDSTLLDE